MPHYMLRWNYKDVSAKGLIEKPHDRSVEAKKLVEGFGGKMHQHFLALGDFDGLAICEFPDHTAAAACSMTASASGGFAAVHTTVLLTAKEAESALKHAGQAKHGFKAPHG